MSKEYGTFTYKEAELEVSADFTKGWVYDDYRIDDPNHIEIIEVLYKGSLIEFIIQACQNIQLTEKTLEIMYDVFSYVPTDDPEFNVTQMFTKGPLDITELERQMLDDIYSNQ